MSLILLQFLARKAIFRKTIDTLKVDPKAAILALLAYVERGTAGYMCIFRPVVGEHGEPVTTESFLIRD